MFAYIDNLLSLSIACFNLYFHYESLSVLITEWRFFFVSLKGYLSLVYLVLSSLAYDFTFVWIAMENTITTSVMLVFSLAVLIRLKQADRLLQLRPFTRYNLNRFRRLHTETLLQILQSNRFTGVLIFVHMLFIAPMSCYIMSGLMRGEFNLKAFILFGSVAVFQYDGLIVLHLLATLYTKAIHRCGRRLLYLSVHKGHSLRLYDRMHLVFYIEKFHCERKYGITYGYTSGVMSFHSFVKVGPIKGE